MVLIIIYILYFLYFKRPGEHDHLSKGFISLSGLQFRGHAFFSDKDCTPDSDTIEYAWLMEMQCGTISGKVTLPQVFLTISGECNSPADLELSFLNVVASYKCYFCQCLLI